MFASYGVYIQICTQKRFWGSGAKQMEQILFKVAQSYDDAHYNSWIIVCAADFLPTHIFQALILVDIMDVT